MLLGFFFFLFSFRAVIFLHRLVRLFFPLPSVPCVPLGVSPLICSQTRKGRAVSFLLFKIQQARYCWELPLFSRACLFTFHLSLSSLRREHRPAAGVAKRPQHARGSDTPSCPLHLYVPRTEWSPSGDPSLHMHPATAISLISLFEPSRREALCVSIGWSNKKFPVVTSWLLTVCPLGWQRESEANIGRRSCHTPISALMSHIKRCPYLNVLLKGKKLGEVCVDVCICVRKVVLKGSKKKTGS